MKSRNPSLLSNSPASALVGRRAVALPNRPNCMIAAPSPPSPPRARGYASPRDVQNTGCLTPRCPFGMRGCGQNPHPNPPPLGEGETSAAQIKPSPASGGGQGGGDVCDFG